MQLDSDSFLIHDEVMLCARAADLDPDRVRELAIFAHQRGQTLISVLVEREDIKESILLEGLAEILGLEFQSTEVDRVLPEVLGMIPPAIAMTHQVFPLRQDGQVLAVACSDPFNWKRWDELGHVLERNLKRVLCPSILIKRMLKTHYGLGADTVDRIVADKKEQGLQVKTKLATSLSDDDAANEPTVVNLVNKILAEGIKVGATDIHFESYENKYRVRYRIDGVLEDVSLPASVNMLRAAVVSRIKVMSNLDITEKRLPQDGRSQVSLDGKDYDLRVSILPGVYGEAVVIRVQYRGMVSLSLDALGYGDIEKQKISQLIKRPNGLILVTGPTGSGKTTTLYTCLNDINDADTKIITIEDPVEYWMEGILQMQVRDEIGFRFAEALRGMLRHDPDVLLVGEIRDIETAEIAIRAALTGHLVFATLHTNDAPSAVSRLLDLGLEPLLLASALRGIIAQRLVRRICTACRQPVDPGSLDEFERELLQKEDNWSEVTFWRGNGCEKCRFTGYSGRTAISEVLTVDQHIRRMIQERCSADRIKQAAVENDMQTLMRTGLQAIRNGLTSLSEVYRVTQEDV